MRKLAFLALITALTSSAYSSSFYSPLTQLTQLPPISNNTILGNNSGGTATPSALTASQTKTLLSITNTDVSGLGTASTANTGTSGHNLPFLDGANTFSATNIFSSTFKGTGGYAAWSATTPGTAAGSLNFPSNGIDGQGPAITFSTNDSAQPASAGIYVTGTSAAGSSMFLATTDVYSTGSKTAISINPAGNVGITRGTFSVGGVTDFNSSGVLQAAGFPALTGDVTTSAGSLATTLSSATVVSKVSGQALTPASVAATGVVTSSGATSGIGYATGAGGTVTQLTSRTTGVTCSKMSCGITLVSAAGSATWNTFTVTNTGVVATDVIVCSQQTGANLYNVIATNVASGSYKLSVSAVSGTATESPVINCNVIKGVSS